MWRIMRLLKGLYQCFLSTNMIFVATPFVRSDEALLMPQNALANLSLCYFGAGFV